MKVISIEELERIDPSTCCIVDLRPEDQYRRGTFPGAVNIPMEQFDERKRELQREKTVYLLCHTGERSQAYAEELGTEGYDAVNVNGGYRAYLKLSLSRYMEKESEEKRREKTAEIERSIIKKYRKSIWRPFTKALNEYQLIQEGDRIAVCISGGKDSMLLAKLVQELKRHGKIPFEAVFLVMNPGYNADNWKIIQDNASLLGIPLTVFEIMQESIRKDIYQQFKSFGFTYVTLDLLGYRTGSMNETLPLKEKRYQKKLLTHN